MKKDVIVCRCEEVSREEIEEAIRDGAQTVDGVKRRTRAGMGLCQGRTCSRAVAQMISRELGRPPEEVPLARSRPPVRPVKLTELGGLGE